MIDVKDGRLQIQPHFTADEAALEEGIKFKKRDAVIYGANDKPILNEKGVLFPETWSDTAVNVTVDKYFRINPKTKKKEKSLKEVVNRVVDTIAASGVEQRYFDEANAAVFRAQLKHMIYNQMYSFNSPVWFNVGIDDRPNASACYNLDVEDSMYSIMELATKEAMIFKNGSGAGVNYSKLRGKGEPLSKGGYSSGSVGFIKGLDSLAGIIKSGGATRRAASLAMLNDDHPDIEEFITCKVNEEKKARALIANGYSANFHDEDGAYQTVAFQNGNHSMMVTDKFMKAAANGDKWSLRNVVDGKTSKRVKADALLRLAAECAWETGDPGIAFYDTINNAHTVPVSGRIVSGNPCLENLDVPNSACNLGSLNLAKFIALGQDSEGTFWFDTKSFTFATEIAVIAQDIIVKMASYPTEEIEKNAHYHHQLGIGYTNLGTILMVYGWPYDSDESRMMAAVIASMMTSAAYSMSARLAHVFHGMDFFRKNANTIHRVLDEHWDKASELIEWANVHSGEVYTYAELLEPRWEETKELVKQYGLRNSRVTLMAPTGTISFMMDCKTTGIEPEMSWVKTKKFVGGSEIKSVNTTIVHSLRGLGYDEDTITKILKYLEESETVEGCPELNEKDIPVFDCAVSSGAGSRSISPEAHVKMVAAIQPHISAGISKTVNLPESATVDDVERIFKMSHELGVKSITVYRDHSKISQPLNVVQWKKSVAQVRYRLSDDIDAKRHKFKIAGQSGYLHVGFFDDKRVGEIFITMSKAGSTMSGLLDCLSIAVSMALQYGVPLRAMINKFAYTNFEPSGMTKNKNIRMAKSVVDYVFRYLDAFDIDKNGEEEPEEEIQIHVGMSCYRCGQLMIRSGKCHTCPACGDTSSCG